MGNFVKCVCGVCGVEYYFLFDVFVVVWIIVVLDFNYDLEGFFKFKNYMIKLNKFCNFEGFIEYVDGFVVFYVFWLKLDYGFW